MCDMTHLYFLQGIIHRDIKPENILLMADRSIKLADFGLSIDATFERPVTRAGTLDYMAPEVGSNNLAHCCCQNPVRTTCCVPVTDHQPQCKAEHPSSFILLHCSYHFTLGVNMA